jgi:heme/copper-type cytochrome/quinol oxidase subunit 2
MNSVSEEVFSTTIKKAKPKQIRTTQENVIIISTPTLTSITSETKKIVSEPNITPNTIEKEIINTEEKSKNLLFYIVFGLLVVSLLVIFTLLFVIYSNRRRKEYKIIKFV